MLMSAACGTWICEGLGDVEVCGNGTFVRIKEMLDGLAAPGEKVSDWRPQSALNSLCVIKSGTEPGGEDI